MNSGCRRHAGLLRRLGAMLYDGFLLAGVMIVAAIPLPLFQSAADASSWVRALIQIYLVVVCFLFFGWFWMVVRHSACGPGDFDCVASTVKTQHGQLQLFAF